MKPIIAANWKMNFTIDESLNLIDEIIKKSPSNEAELIFFPNYISLRSVQQKLFDSAYKVGSQNVNDDENGDCLIYTSKSPRDVEESRMTYST